MKRPLELKLQERSGDNSGKRVRGQQDDLLALLKLHFGYSSFRGKQEEAIKAVLAGKDCFCLMPTGGGKSLCYELPALARPGIALIVSPLIALMENQVAALKAKRIAAEFLSSIQSAAIRTKIFADLDSPNPKLRLLYVTPEALDMGGNLSSKLRKLHGRGLLSLFAIDEAHCISSWGHDFRPSYRRLSSLRENFPSVPILALTATAAKKVRDDVVQSLQLRQPAILVSSFNRPNIFYEVRFRELLDEPYEDLRDLLLAAPQECAIIYCFKRETCNELGARLAKDGVPCKVYHAGLNASVRTKALEDWSAGRVPVVIATIAFGMGIDRAAVRLVVHYNVPKTLEGFYQESGRAGRDQKLARSVLYYSLHDKDLMAFIIGEEAKRKKAAAGAGRQRAAEAESKHAAEAFAQVIEFCEETGCRRRKLLAHFGEQAPASLCAKTCDACRAPGRLAAALQQLASVATDRSYAARRGGYGTRPAPAAERNPLVDSEFWRGGGDEDLEEEEEEEEEEGISDSEEEDSKAAVEVSRAKGKAPGKTSVEQRLESMLRAEEAFNARQRPQKKSKLAALASPSKSPRFTTAGKLHSCGPSGTKPSTIPESLRESARQRLRSGIEDVSRRDQTALVTPEQVQAWSEDLENDTFTHFAKSGKSFYLSRIASTFRWLSSASLADCKSRLAF